MTYSNRWKLILIIVMVLIFGCLLQRNGHKILPTLITLENNPNNSRGEPVIEQELVSFEELQDWYSTMEEQFYQRKQILEEACKKYQNIVIRKTNRPPLYILNVKSFVTCLIPKVGTTTIEAYMGRLSDHHSKKFQHLNVVNDTGRWVHKEVKQLLDTRNNISSKEIIKILTEDNPVTNNGNSLIRLITVRPPVERLISAYKMFTNGIVTDFENRAPEEENQKENIKIKKNNTQSLEQWISKSIKTNNIHWKPYDSLCSPCFFKYDYILHLETFEEDLKYIYEKAGLQDEENHFNIKFHQTETITKTNIDHYFSLLPKQLLESIYLKYRQDFYLFGYDLPNYLKQFEKEGD